MRPKFCARFSGGLTSAMYAGWHEGLGFQVEPVELTVQAVVDKDAVQLRTDGAVQERRHHG